MNLHSKRYILPALAATTALAVGGGFALNDAAVASASVVNAQQAASQNWAGYVADSKVGDGKFSNVSGSWVGSLLAFQSAAMVGPCRALSHSHRLSGRQRRLQAATAAGWRRRLWP